MNTPLSQQALDFAVNVITICDNIHNRGVIKNQLLRAATSIGANIHEAQYGYSKDDFVYKLQIALKESNETSYWLQLLEKTQTITPEDAHSLEMQCSRIRFLLIRSLNTAKKSAP